MSETKMPEYAVITPVRNEGEIFSETIKSMVSQRKLPCRWIIVDDGSSDETGELADAAAKVHSWISVVHRKDRGFRKQGGGVVEAFYDGYELINNEAWDFIVKLDGDLSFGPDYFEKSLEQFAQNQKLGIGGGRIYCRRDGVETEDSPGDPGFHVRGATKIYRRQLWEAIGGVVRMTGWDTIDEIKANMLGWQTYSFPELRLLQLKDTGSADGAWRNWVKNGRANYIIHYHPVFMLAKCVKRVFTPPYFLAAFGLAAGFAGGYLRRVPRIEDLALARYVRDQQLRKLTMRPNIWDWSRPERIRPVS